MNKLDKQYLDLVQDILDNGVTKGDRTGTGTKSVFGRQIRHKMSDGFPLLTTKKMYMKGIVTELLWFLRGETNIKSLVDQGNNIWVGDCYKNWCKQFDIDVNNYDVDELVKGHGDQCWGYPILDYVKPTSKAYKKGQINAYLEGKAEKPSFYLTQEEFIDKIKTDIEFATKWGELGPTYGKQWRSWTQNNKAPWGGLTINQVDQIANLIRDLKNNPDSRRLIVSAWNVAEIDQVVLPPCHNFFQCWTRELSIEERTKLIKNNNSNWCRNDAEEELYINMELEIQNTPTRALSLMWNQRSVDTGLGLPFNIASYGLLLEILAKTVNMVPDELIGNLADTHIYLDQVEDIKEQLGREAFDLPTLKIKPEVKWAEGDCLPYYSASDFTLENYQSHSTIKLNLSN